MDRFLAVLCAIAVMVSFSLALPDAAEGGCPQRGWCPNHPSVQSPQVDHQTRSVVVGGDLHSVIHRTPNPAFGCGPQQPAEPPQYVEPPKFEFPGEQAPLDPPVAEVPVPEGESVDSESHLVAILSVVAGVAGGLLALFNGRNEDEEEKNTEAPSEPSVTPPVV